MATWKTHYRPPELSSWKGREDGDRERYFQIIEELDLNQASWPSLKNQLVLLGFCSDEGIQRNHGRVGASEGPRALREQLGKLATHNAIPKLNDGGDLLVNNGDLELAQEDLGLLVHELLTHQALPVVIGGGHETALGHFKGLIHQPWAQGIAIVNFDAHFDLRPANQSTSGTPFLQIAELCQGMDIPFHYYCFGVQPQSNTASLFKKADELEVEYRTVEELYTQAHLLKQDITSLLVKHQAIYVTVCMDVFDSVFAPGVSATSVQGLQPWQVIPPLIQLAQSGKTKSFDIVELSPQHDQNHRTAQLAATLVSYFIENWVSHDE